MRQHLFIAVDSREENGYFQCDYHIRNIKKLKSEVNHSPGYIYLNLIGTQQFYEGKIIKINYTNIYSNPTKHIVNDVDSVFKRKKGIIYILMRNHMLEIEVKGLKKINEEEFKYLYAQSNKKNVGVFECSLFNTYHRGFKFARPVIASEVFDSEFAEEILKDYFIIPDNESGDENDIYAEVTIEDNEYIISLITKQMIEEDEKFVNGQGSENYRPYFYEFVLDENGADRIQSVIEPYQTYVVQLTLRKEGHSEDNLIAGDVFFSASPPRSVQGYIDFLNKDLPEDIKKKIKCIEKKIVNKVENIAVVDEKKIKEHFFNNIHSSLNIDNVQIYNVGQGNLSKVQLKAEDGKMFDIVFDIGRSRNNAPNSLYELNVKKAVRELGDKYMFILSHWDLDHILGIIHLDKKKFETLWIVPQLPNEPRGAARRLAAYLSYSTNINSIFISERLNGDEIFSESGFSLAKGKANDPKLQTPGTSFNYTEANNLGLVLEITENEKKVLLTGDCEYTQMPDDFLTGYDFMVASHHGAKTDLSGSGLKPGKEAILTVNTGCKKYLNGTHVKQLRKLGYNTTTIDQTGNKKWSF